MSTNILDQIKEYTDLYAKVTGPKPTVTLTDKGRVRVENQHGETLISQTEFSGLLNELRVSSGRLMNVYSPFGWLTYWTIYQGLYEVDKLAKVAKENELPKVFSGYIQGATEKSAWVKATQLGAIGVDYEGPVEPGCSGKFYSKNLGGETRAIVIEIVDQNNKIVNSIQVATIGRDDDNIVADIHTAHMDEFSVDETIKLIRNMQDDLNSRVGQIDDTRIRQSVLAWLEDKYRVCVRGSGGVYFIPGTKDEVRDEILSVRRWITDTGLGIFSVVTLSNDGATSINDFQESAVDEILKEIRDIADKAENYTDVDDEEISKRSINTQMQKIQGVWEKVQALEKNLGSIRARVEAEYQVTYSTVRKLHEQVRDRNPLTSRKEDNTDQNKKSGTALDRKKGKKSNV